MLLANQLDVSQFAEVEVTFLLQSIHRQLQIHQLPQQRQPEKKRKGLATANTMRLLFQHFSEAKFSGLEYPHVVNSMVWAETSLDHFFETKSYSQRDSPSNAKINSLHGSKGSCFLQYIPIVSDWGWTKKKNELIHRGCRVLSHKQLICNFTAEWVSADVVSTFPIPLSSTTG